MNRTHLHRPTSRGSLFQWSVADRTVAACGTGLIGEQPPSRLLLTAQISDNRGRFPALHSGFTTNRKELSRRPLRHRTWPEVTAAEKKPRSGAYPHPDLTGFRGALRGDMASCRSGATKPLLPQVKEQLAAAQVLHSREAAAAIDVIREVRDAEDVVLEELRERTRILLNLQPELEVVLVGEVLAGHVPRIAAVGDLAHGVDAQERDERAVRFAAHLRRGERAVRR